jgi:EAL domain-containing protein (putative c-di-GMP-specific phosphodiesterase class I)/GGDEF domain-containing protein
LRVVPADELAAAHDPFTGLPGRLLALDRLGQALVRCGRSRDTVACLVLDMTRSGAKPSRARLRDLAGRLRQATRDVDTVARFDDEHFVVILPDLEHPTLAGRVAERILAGFAAAGPAAAAAIGIALFPLDGRRPEELLQRGRCAAAAAPPGDYRFCTDSADAGLRARIDLERDLGAALARDELLLHYQPRVDLGSGRVAGVEALVRWHHPALGLLAPGDFVPLAEDTGLIGPLGEWVLREAACQSRRWQEAGLDLTMSVNLSARQLDEADLPGRVVQALREAGADPHRLELEVTETAVLRDPGRAADMLACLAGHGVCISMDDFGTGWSGLSYLRHLPLDLVKIDQSFVRNAGGDGDDATIVRAVVDLARNLGIGVVAEGVEKAGQARWLRDIGCGFGQGWHFGRPGEAARVRRLLG